MKTDRRLLSSSRFFLTLDEDERSEDSLATTEDL
jgi:hypothetical protein